VQYAGAADAEPAPGVVDAILASDIVLVAPSNPVSSIFPILAVPGIRDGLRQTNAILAGISPIVAGAAVSGPAGILMAAQNLPVSISGIAQSYADFLDVLIADNRDREAAEQLASANLEVHCTNTLMRSLSDRAALARAVLGFIKDETRDQVMSDSD
jgi:LPPG:FO 2-phospho-L-lactate transferase